MMLSAVRSEKDQGGWGDFRQWGVSSTDPSMANFQAISIQAIQMRADFAFTVGDNFVINHPAPLLKK